MVERTPNQIPDWAKRERTNDLVWIQDNLHIFLPAASAGFEQMDAVPS